jgi:hypothetical protein
MAELKALDALPDAIDMSDAPELLDGPAPSAGSSINPSSTN